MMRIWIRMVVMEVLVADQSKIWLSPKTSNARKNFVPRPRFQTWQKKSNLQRQFQTSFGRELTMRNPWLLFRHLTFKSIIKMAASMKFLYFPLLIHGYKKPEFSSTNRIVDALSCFSQSQNKIFKSNAWIFYQLLFFVDYFHSFQASAFQPLLFQSLIS